jgi:hypothetical protein
MKNSEQNSCTGSAWVLWRSRGATAAAAKHQQSRRPVEGHDPDDPAKQEAARRALAGVPHDEPADDEEHVDAVRADVAGQIEARRGRRVEIHHHERRERAQQVQVQQHRAGNCERQPPACTAMTTAPA